MIPKSGYRFSEKIMLKQQAKAKWRFKVIPFRFSVACPDSVEFSSNYFPTNQCFKLYSAAISTRREQAAEKLGELRPILAPAQCRACSGDERAGKPAYGMAGIRLCFSSRSSPQAGSMAPNARGWSGRKFRRPEFPERRRHAEALNRSTPRPRPRRAQGSHCADHDR